MRFLGYGIGHKDQTKRVELSDNEAGDHGDVEDDLDKQNIARIAQSQYVQPPLAATRKRRGGNQQFAEDPEEAAISDAEIDDEYDLDGDL